MERFIISTGTVTYAMKGRDILRKNGYKAYTERRTKNIGKYGCGYVIIVETKDISAVKNMLVSGGVKILNVEKTAVL